MVFRFVAHKPLLLFQPLKGGYEILIARFLSSSGLENLQSEAVTKAGNTLLILGHRLRIVRLLKLEEDTGDQNVESAFQGPKEQLKGNNPNTCTFYVGADTHNISLNIILLLTCVALHYSYWHRMKAFEVVPRPPIRTNVS